MRHGISRAGRDPGFELLEVVGDRHFFFAGSEPSNRLDLKREPPAKPMRAKNKKHGSAGQHGELSPDC